MAKKPSVGEPPFLSSHDEPVVVDNGPMRVDLGRKGVTKRGKIWTRPLFTEFHQLITFEIRRSRVLRAVTVRLDPHAPIVFMIQDGLDTVTVEFARNANDGLDMKSDRAAFEPDTAEDRRLVVRDRDLRVRQIRVKPEGENDYVSLPVDKPQHLFAIIVPKSEEPHDVPARKRR